MNDAPFKSADHALRTSFELVSKAIIKNASITAVMTGGSPPPGTMSAQEKHAQAAMVVAYCFRLPENWRAYIYARYAGRDQRQMAFNNLALYILVGVPFGDATFKAYRTIVEQYFSSKKTEIRSIRKDLRVHNYEALAIRRVAFERLDTVHTQAIGVVTRHMEDKGLITEAGK